MKIESRYSLLVWAVVALVVMNLTILGTLLYQRYKNSGELVSSPEKTSIQSQSQEVFSGRYFMDNLNMTSEQLNEFQRFNPVFRNSAAEINFRLDDLRNAMLEEMAGPDPDIKRLNELSDSIGQLHSKLKKLTYRYYLDIRNICSPAQYPLIEEMFAMTFRGGRRQGKGYHYRMRQGRGNRVWNN